MRQHRLARARLAHHEQAVAAGRGDLEGALGAGVALDVGQVGIARGAVAGRGAHAGPAVVARIDGPAAAGDELAHHVEQVPGPVHLRTGHQRGLLGAVQGQHQPHGRALRVGGHGHRERAAHGAQFARQRQLAGELVAGEAGVLDLPAGREDAQRDGQVEAARVLRQIGRGEVDDDLLVGRKFEPGVLDRRAHAFARLLDLGLGQPDQREARQAVRQMHLDRDGGGLQAEQGAALHQRQTHFSPSPQVGAPATCKPRTVQRASVCNCRKQGL
ncbi:hypothetical protein D3C86_1304200 [compost metagenome]